VLFEMTLIRELKFPFFVVMAVLVSITTNISYAERYFTWIDDNGNLRNTYIDVDKKVAQSKVKRAKRISSLTYTGESQDLQTVAKQLAPGEKKRRYFTFVDQEGNMQSSFYADKSDITSRQGYILKSGERASDYISSDVFEGGGAPASEAEPFYTWTDGLGNIQNTNVSSKERALAFKRRFGQLSRDVEFTEGNELNLKISDKPSLNDSITATAVNKLDGALAEVLGEDDPAVYEAKSERETLARKIANSCCQQIPDSAFTKLEAKDSIYAELNKFSRRYQFPTGESYFQAYKLPYSRHTYGLKVKSFAQKGILYPSLMFLDEDKQPTRLLSDAIYKLHPENFMRYAFIEGTVQITPYQNERYVILLTTDQDLSQKTLDNLPFEFIGGNKRVSSKQHMKEYAHKKTGSFELAVVK